jgi:hypothetical protein
MKPVNTGPAANRDVARHPSPLGSQQGVAEKSDDSKASVKARMDSKNMPDTPALHRQHIPNSSGRK